jgi:hypothetical protein
MILLLLLIDHGNTIAGEGNCHVNITAGESHMNEDRDARDGHDSFWSF